MGVVRALRRVVGSEAGLYECRHCGTTLDGEESTCPNCGTGEIAHYEL
jgi:rubrerythrin